MAEKEKDWICVYTSSEPHKVNIVKALLEDNQIASFEINKKDSAYIAIGDINLYVKTADEVLASFLIKKNNL